MIDIKLPIWLNKNAVAALATASAEYWQSLLDELQQWPEKLRLDSDNPAAELIDVIAAGRNVQRIKNEPLNIYHARVKHAIANAKDAGGNAGIQRVFERMGFSLVQVKERIEGHEWDMVEISLLADEYNPQQQLVNELIRTYGRTCRRYFTNVIAVADSYQQIGGIDIQIEVNG